MVWTRIRQGPRSLRRLMAFLSNVQCDKDDVSGGEPGVRGAGEADHLASDRGLISMLKQLAMELRPVSGHGRPINHMFIEPTPPTP